MAQIIGPLSGGLQGRDLQVIRPLLDTSMPAHVVTDMRPTRLLGFVSARSASALQSALATVAGPAVAVQRGPEVALLMQAELKTPPIRRGRRTKPEGLQTVQRRLEIACQAGPFLAMDPAAACCPTGIIPRLLEAAWSSLSDALAAHGARHQWDVIVRRLAQPTVSRQRVAIEERCAGGSDLAMSEVMPNSLREAWAEREAALLAVLKPSVLALGQVCHSETQMSITVLLPAEGDVAVKAALAGLPKEIFADCTFDMHGPLPPLSFSAVKLAKVGQGEVVRAWRRLDLPECVDASSLHWHWRLREASAHSDRKPKTKAASADAEVIEITKAYHLLRDLLPAPGMALEGQTSMAQLLQRAGHRLIVPKCDLPRFQQQTGPNDATQIETLDAESLEAAM